MKLQLLLYGEGDFSFTRAVCELIHSERWDTLSEWLGCEVAGSVSGWRVVATSLDSRREVLEKYPSFSHIDWSQYMSCVDVSVHHGINALDAEQRRALLPQEDKEGLRTWIIWNHPHLGREDCGEHFELLCHFFHSLARQESNIRVLMMFLKDQVKRWRVQEAAEKHGFSLTSVGSVDESKFPKYLCKRNLTGDSFKSARTRSNIAEPELESVFCLFSPSADDVTLPKPDLSLIPSDATTVTPPVKDVVACTLCGKSFKTNQGLSTHTRQVHELGLYQDKAVVTQCCGREFHGQSALLLHQRSAHGELPVKRKRLLPGEVTEGTQPCTVCGSTRLDHVDRFGANLPELLLTCSECQKEFRGERALNQHKNIVHP